MTFIKIKGCFYNLSNYDEIRFVDDNKRIRLLYCDRTGKGYHGPDIYFLKGEELLYDTCKNEISEIISTNKSADIQQKIQQMQKKIDELEHMILYQPGGIIYQEALDHFNQDKT